VKVLVTGGAGFIGHHLVQGLLARGDEVRIIDDLSTGDAARLALGTDDLDLTVASVLDADALDRAIAGCAVVFHHAAIASVARSIDEPRLVDDVNVGGTIEVMAAAARHGVRRVVFAGSSAVYGIPDELPCREATAIAPVSPYGIGKAAAERYIHVLGRLHGIETVVLRYFNVFGPGQDPASEYAAVVPRFVEATLAGRRSTIHGDGRTTRDFIYVDDVVHANLLAADLAGISGTTCNVASGRRVDLLTLLSAIGSAVGVRVEPTFGPSRPGDIRDSEADISEARRILRFEPAVAFDDGIARTVEWYRARSGT